MNRKLTLVNSLKLLLVLFFCSLQKNVFAQANFGGRTADTLNLVVDFGADSTGAIDASYALIKASRYIENKWKKSGDTLLPSDPPNINYDSNYVRLEIPSGTYKVGKEISFLSIPYDTFYVNSTNNPGTKILKYSTIYGSGNNREGITIETGWNSCISKYLSKRYSGTQLFNITNASTDSINRVDGVEIIGIGSTKPVFKYADSIHVGWMDTLGNPVDTTTNQCGNLWPLHHQSANLFYVEFCNNIKISNIEIDGNIRYALYMGSGSDGYQGGAFGLRLNAKHISLDRLYIHHMQDDGIYLTDQDSLSQTYLVADSIVSQYNRRTGFTWSIGDSIIVKNSKFNNIGRDTSILQSGRILETNPNVGIDIEYQNEFLDSIQYQHKYLIRNGYFINCEFLNSRGRCVENNYTSQAGVRTKNINFKNCTFHKIDGWGLWCHGNKFTFDSCKIYCSIVHSGFGDSLNEETKYKNCQFEDKPYGGKHMIDGDKLVHIDGYKKTLFQNCTFTVNDKKRDFFFLNWNNSMPKTDWTVFDNDTFIYNNLGRPMPDEGSLMEGIKFRGHNTIKNTLNGLNSFHIMKTKHTVLEGSSDPCKANTLIFEGQVQHIMNGDAVDTFNIGNQISNADGYAEYKVDNKALLVVDSNVRVEIGTHSGLQIMKGGSLYNGGKYYLDGGQMILHPESFVFMQIGHVRYEDGSANHNSLFYIDKNCNPNNATISPIWSNGIGYGTGTTTPIGSINSFLGDFNNGTWTKPCIQGKHHIIDAAIPASQCSPLYTNIISSNSISILYNKTVSCFGTGTAAFNFKIVGGTAPYSDTLDGAYTTDTSFASIATGNHTLKVKDSNGCVETFNINIDTIFQYKIIKGCVAGSDAKFSTNACSQPSYTAPSGAAVSYNSGTKTFSVNKAGTYTLTSGGVTLSFYIGRCDTCSIADSTAQWYPPDSSISSIFSDGIAPSSAIVLSGIIHVDTTLYIYNNDHVFLTANTQFIVDSNHSMIVNKSKLRGCNKYWDGIKADGKDRIVIVNNSSQLQDMSSGVQIMNNAFLQARNSTYLNNATNSISFKNMSDLNYNGMIWSNLFKSDTNFITFSGTNKGETGIKIFNSNYLNIGQQGDTSLGNLFSNLYTGIHVYCDSNINTVLDDTTNQIGIFNNKFAYIQSDSTQNIPNAYTSLKGTGVYIDYSHAPGFDAHATVSFTKPTISSLVLFDSCYKAIVSINNNLIDSSLYLKNCNFGIMNNNLMSKGCFISHNKIENTFLGIQFVGNYTKYKALNNIITTNQGYVQSNFGYGMMALLLSPIGIDIKQMSPVFNLADTFQVSNNDISLPYDIGKGIASLGANGRQYITNNKISFTMNSGTPAPPQITPVDPSLYGIFSSNCQGAVYDKNSIEGIHDPNVYDATYSKGLYFETSHDYKVSCNFISYTKQGLYAFGNNSTDSIGITNNKFKFNRNPIYTLDNGSAQSGTFGQIGGSTIENGNDFIYNTTDSTWLQNGLFKVWRESDTSITDQIITSSTFLTQSESGAPSTNKEYEVQNIAFNYADTTCPNTSFVFGTVPGDYPVDEDIVDWASVDEANAELIANQEEIYIDYFETGRWLNIRYLFELLYRDSLLRNNNFILNNFYNNYQNTNIGRLNDADAALAQVFDFKGSYNGYIERYNDAVDANEGIAIDGLQDEYEYVVNKIAINLGIKGADSIVEADRMQLEIIANTCPFVGGTAVYKARTLWSVFNPLQQYNDRVNCLAAYGQGKMANNVNIDSLYEAKANQKGAVLAQLIKNNEQQNPKPNSNYANTLVVYPNPANDYINIEYTQMRKGNFILYDILGKEIMNRNIEGRLNSEKIHLPNVPDGIYTYKIVFDTESFTGKLNILK